MEVVNDAGALCESGTGGTGLRAGHPVADTLISEMCLILALQKELEVV